MGLFTDIRKWYRNRRTAKPLFHDRFLAESRDPGMNIDKAFLLAMQERSGPERAESWYRYNTVKKSAPPLALGESAALTILCPKVAAILYDRLWACVSIWEPQAPLDLFFATEDFTFTRYLFNDGSENPTVSSIAVDIANDSERHERAFKEVTDEVESALGRPVTPCFGIKSAYDAAYKEGNADVLVTAIERLPFMSESRLQWEQVEDVRHDRDARESIRQFFKWANVEFLGRDAKFISEQIEWRYSKYADAMKKHGLETRLSYLEMAFDWQSKAGAAATIVGLHAAGIDEMISAISGAAVAIGGAAVTVAKKKLELDSKLQSLRKEHSDISFLASLSA